MINYKNCSAVADQQATIMQNNPLRIQSLPTGDIIDFYLPIEIDSGIDEYIDFFRAVTDAKSTDTIVVHINCYGGDINTAFNIIDVLNQSQARVQINLEGECASAASMIMLCGDQWSISEHSRVMIHAWSSWKVGKWNEQQSSFDFDKKWLEPAFRDTYKDFLTESEIEDVLRGKDIYLNSEETRNRLEKYQEKDIKKQELLQSIAQKHQDEINKEIEVALRNFEESENKPTKKTTKSPAKKLLKK